MQYSVADYSKPNINHKNPTTSAGVFSVLKTGGILNTVNIPAYKKFLSHRF
jgi:hypothetical protein